MRQFDVFVFEDQGPEFNSWEPAFEDPALGWFHSENWNEKLSQIDAEWIVFTCPGVTVDRNFLNSLAEVTDGFPMVDAFAPRLKCNGHFYGGTLLNGGKGFAPISEERPMGYVAMPNPAMAVFSSRIIQRTGLFDLDLPPEFRLMDYTLRMAHAGGKMFNVPYLVTTVKDELEHYVRCDFLKKEVAPQWEIFYKNLNAKSLIGYTLRHPSMLPRFIGLDKAHKARDIKRDKATDLSKFSDKYLKEISL